MKKSVKSWYKIVGLVALVVLAIGTGLWLFQTAEQIAEFQYEQDATDVLKIFERDRYWLLASEESDPDFMLRYLAPNKWDPQYFGKFKIKVLRKEGELVGFTAYYMKSPLLGFIQFVAVNPPFRGKGYAQQLLDYAIKQLKSMGAIRVELLTRTTNERAQKLYKRNNFQVKVVEDGYIYFFKNLIERQAY